MNREMEIGDFVADAHDGLEVDGFLVASSIQIRCEGSSKIVEAIMKQAGIDKIYCNKYVVIVDYGYDGKYKGVYSYDGDRLGVVVYAPKPK